MAWERAMKIIIKIDKSIKKIMAKFNQENIPVYNHDSGYLPIGKANIKSDKHKNIVADIILDTSLDIARHIENNINDIEFNIGGVVKDVKKGTGEITGFSITEISVSPRRG